MQRRQIEDHILALARNVDTRDGLWMDGEGLSEFIDGWRSLAQYYQWNPDTTLGAHVLKLYMRYAVSLRRIIEDERLSPRRRQKAQMVLDSLDEHLDSVFRQIERNGGVRAAV
jgi:hypothetical protein